MGTEWVFYQAFEWYIQVSCKYYTFGGNHILVWLSKFSKLTIFFKIHNLQARRLGKVAVCQKSCKNWFLGLKKTMGSRKSLLKKNYQFFPNFKKSFLNGFRYQNSPLKSPKIPKSSQMCIFFDILRFLVENKIKQKNQYSRSEPLGTGV